jgi:hypothetical protein
MTDQSTSQTVVRPSLLISIGLYATSFLLPVTDADSMQVMYGYQAFVWGFLFVVFLPMWMANPLFWIGCHHFYHGRFQVARNASLTASALAVSELWLWDDRPSVGYFLWLASMLLLAVTAHRHMRRLPVST